MPNITLVSSSNYHGSGYLDHCEIAITDLFAGGSRILFVPFALSDHDGYAAIARTRFRAMGFQLDSLHESPHPVESVTSAEGLFIGGGNTFRLLNQLYAGDLLEPIRNRVAAGIPYLGTSAGSIVACPTIKTTNDMPIVSPPSFTALGLVNFQVNAHYLDPDPDSKHQGETRELRIQQFHEENSLPVIGLREGSWLAIEQGAVRLSGAGSARLFLRDQPPIEIEGGAALDRCLDGTPCVA
ncbi:MAG: dipeptidase PepE [Thermoanaerobaculia bacterium]